MVMMNGVAHENRAQALDICSKMTSDGGIYQMRLGKQFLGEDVGMKL